MIRGLNTNIKRNDKIYHIQTEDSGVKSAIITAHLFLDGAVLAAVKTDYADIAEMPEETLVIEVAERMRKAHRQMINRLTSGDFDEKKKASKVAAKIESIVLTDDSNVVEENDESVTTENDAQEKPQQVVTAADFQALLEYDDDDDDVEEVKTVVPLPKKKSEKHSEDKPQASPKEIEQENPKPEKTLAGMTRAERVVAILERFEVASDNEEYSVSAHIKQLLDGDET